MFAASLLVLGCSAPAPTPQPRLPCPAPSQEPNSAALHRISAELTALDPGPLDVCVVGFMGGAVVARFEARNTGGPAFAGTPVPDADAAAILEGLRTVFPHRIGDRNWSLVASGSETSNGNVEHRLVFKGPGKSHLYVFDWAG